MATKTEGHSALKRSWTAQEILERLALCVNDDHCASNRGATDKNGAMNQSYFDAYMSGIASNLRNGNTDSAKASAQQIVNSLSDEQYAKMKSVFAAHGISIG